MWSRARNIGLLPSITNALPGDHLLDAAHIIANAHELLGRPLLAKGIALLFPAEAGGRRLRSRTKPSGLPATVLRTAGAASPTRPETAPTAARAQPSASFP